MKKVIFYVNNRKEQETDFATTGNWNFIQQFRRLQQCESQWFMTQWLHTEFFSISFFLEWDNLTQSAPSGFPHPTFNIRDILWKSKLSPVGGANMESVGTHYLMTT